MTTESWRPFDMSKPFSSPLCWLFGTHEETDCDVDSSGRTVSWTTGNIITAQGLARVDFDPENGFDIEWIFGDYEIEDTTFFPLFHIELTIPANPDLDNPK